MRRLQHEVRTPIGQILGYGEMLEEEAVERGQHDLVPDLRKIREAAQRVLEIVDGLFQGEVAETRVAATAPGAELATGGESVGARILVVDDEESNRDLLVRQLARRGYAVEAARDGREALHAIEQHVFDLVLLDVLMPGMSGFEVLAAIRRARGPAELPVVMATALDGRDDVVRALELGANDYVTKPLDMRTALARIEAHLSLRRATQKVETLARQLELHGVLLRRTFGRYLSEEVVAELLARPDGLDLKGEKREITVLMADLRGFSSLCESLTPIEVMALLNNHLGAMAEIVAAHGGTVDEFLGDAILAFFGAPVASPDHAARAVACSVEMQLAMTRVNERNRTQRLPEVEMGIGLATGDVVVGNIGSERRAKYGAIGTAVNLASRIESYTLGGEVLISQATRSAAGAALRTDLEREVHPKGFESPIRIYRVAALEATEGRAARTLARERAPLLAMAPPSPVRIALLDGKNVTRERAHGAIEALSPSAARIRSALPVDDLADLRVELLDAAGASLEVRYGKVVERSAEGDGVFVVRFSTRSVRVTDQAR